VFGFRVNVLENLSRIIYLDKNLPKRELDIVQSTWSMQEKDKLITLVDKIRDMK